MPVNDSLHIHVLQHVKFEGPAAIADWITTRGHHLTTTRLYAEATFPSPDAFDWLIVMGGPVTVHDHDNHPWLLNEYQFIRDAIRAHKYILGICLGAQLIAHTLRAKVIKNHTKEIGWFSIDIDPTIKRTSLVNIFPDKLMVFHWHSDMFAIPRGAIPIGSSNACNNQGFILGDRVIGLQFHLESTAASVQNIIQHCADELEHSDYVQTATEILDTELYFQQNHRVLFDMLDKLETGTTP